MRTPRVRPSLVAVLAKSAKIVTVLKLVKFTKVLVTATSLLVSLAFYDLFLDPWIAVGLMAVLVIHEMGHVAALRYKGMGTPLPVFIPFFGAAIGVPDEAYADRHSEAVIAIAGPLVGALATLVCIELWWWTGSKWLLTISFFSAYFNLFNLIPLRPLDGGRILQAVGNQFKYVGLIGLGVVTIWIGQPALVLILILALSDFNRVPNGMRFNIAGGLTLGMTVLFAMGYGEQPPLLSAIDVLLASFFVFLYWRRDVQQESLPFEIVDDLIRPYPRPLYRWGWAGAYLALALCLWLMLWYIIGYLPEP